VELKVEQPRGRGGLSGWSRAASRAATRLRRAGPDVAAVERRLATQLRQLPNGLFMGAALESSPLTLS
jgi:hypothetical protein